MKSAAVLAFAVLCFESVTASPVDIEARQNVDLPLVGIYGD